MEYATHGTLENFVNKYSSTSSYINQEVFSFLLIFDMKHLFELQYFKIILVCFKYT